MKNTKVIKNISIIVIGVCLIVAAGFFIKTSVKKTAGNISTNDIIDADDLRQIAGISSYIFLGEITADNGQTDNETLIRDAGGENSDLAYREYGVIVYENLKGNLKLNVEIPVYKMYIQNADGLIGFVESGDALPQIGQTGVFFVSAHEDGSLDLGGAACFIAANSSPSVNSYSAGIKSSKTNTYETVLNNVKEAIENQILIEQQYKANPAYVED